ncbi:MAG: hypothetical protein K1Y02_13335 [Candidatus Hydrogenedentes bacterium]|nr:hypothetical protein [Candidatus Hydrogenedentota bacterium]
MKPVRLKAVAAKKESWRTPSHMAIDEELAAAKALLSWLEKNCPPREVSDAWDLVTRLRTSAEKKHAAALRELREMKELVDGLYWKLTGKHLDVESKSAGRCAGTHGNVYDIRQLFPPRE